MSKDKEVQPTNPTITLTPKAIKLLGKINGSETAMTYPDAKPSKEWEGMVLDLLEEMGLDQLGLD